LKSIKIKSLWRVKQWKHFSNFSCGYVTWALLVGLIIVSLRLNTEHSHI